ncbi:hypothetical protein GLE_1519 [Lysobacter enzymogenes]|uniref:Uncharacterized protein n=1 Tax=Lysobacter enzymogenes TaxID=69 RepID=A0A0S2DE70_LYSEN|nr:hypothetical protein GLE_1519 [Lysobacter enzymogenes]
MGGGERPRGRVAGLRATGAAKRQTRTRADVLFSFCAKSVIWFRLQRPLVLVRLLKPRYVAVCRFAQR